MTALGLTSPVVAEEQASFKGTLDGVVKVNSVNPPRVSVSVSVSGNSTQLGGKFTVAIPHIVDRTNGTATGTFEFKATNGDKLFAKFSGKSTPSKTQGVLSIVETATITGGTGQFAGARGSFTVKRDFNTANRTTTGSIQGTLSTTVKSSKGEVR